MKEQKERQKQKKKNPVNAERCKNWCGGLPQIIILSILLLWYGFFITQKIDLTTTDLGRHIKNGEIVLTNFSSEIFKTNFYSYSHPDSPFVNHHWGSGVVFFIIWKLTGFFGLSFFYIIISLLTFFIFFRLAQKNSNTTIAFLVSLFLIPLIAERKEIRPEIFSYFFCALFFWILYNYKEKTISFRRLFILVPLQLLWVNLHIYFVFGPFLIGLFLLKKLIERKKRKVKELSILLASIIAVCFLNPSGIKTIIYPLNIFKNYGYKIVENQSVWFLDKLGIINNPNLFLYKIAFAALLLSFVALLIFNRKRFSIILFGLSLTFSVLAWLALRNFTIFGLFALPAITYNIKHSTQKLKLDKEVISAGIIVLTITLFIFGIANNYSRLTNRNFGAGLVPQNNVSAEFFMKENIKGPIFNNYDIGSYLIFHLFPKEKVFVDNRPETYPVSFFENVYIPMQQNNNIWEQIMEEHDFNVIFFAWHDATPWGQKFLIERVSDPDWAPVFADNYAIIFLKRNNQNQPIIEKYEIPKSNFSIQY